MAEAEVFGPKARVELVDGVVYNVSPIGTRHAACVDRLNRWLVLGVRDRAIVRVQGAMQVGEFSEPQPDVVLLRDRANFYADHHPMAPDDVLLVIEVSETSLRFDLEQKMPLYVESGVRDVWVVDLVADVVHAFRDGGVQDLRAGDSLAPLAFPDVVVDVAALFA